MNLPTDSGFFLILKKPQINYINVRLLMCWSTAVYALFARVSKDRSVSWGCCRVKIVSGWAVSLLTLWGVLFSGAEVAHKVSHKCHY